ncbi:MAG TPA: hypothetical protein VFR28_04975 [Allosphingosinicella sp.]|jgi:hypothetical protein|nr:hypothetical protein [Allosphingosinicella sp.]
MFTTALWKMFRTIFRLLGEGINPLVRLAHKCKGIVLVIEVSSLASAALHIAHISVVIQLGA